jgi:hypothetical protein
VKKLAATIGGLAVIAAAWMVGPAFAASLSSATGTVSAGKATVGRCETTGVTTMYNLVTTTVSTVTISNIDSPCGGATLKITVNNGITFSSGTATVPGGGGSATATLAVAVALTQSMENEISVI